MTRSPRIGLFLYGLDRPLSGVTRVGLELAQALTRLNRCEVVLLQASRGGPPLGGAGVRSVWLPGCARLPGLMALGGPLVAAAAHRHRLDLVHDPVGTSPFTLGRWAGRYRRVLTIHDAIAFRDPSGYPWLNRFLHRGFVPATLCNVDAVLTDSQYSASEIRTYLGKRIRNLQVLPLGVHDRFAASTPSEAVAVRDRYDLRGQIVLVVASRQRRKNLEGALRAFARLSERRPDAVLALAGPTQWSGLGLEESVAELGIGSQVRLLGYVPDSDLPSLYRAADVFLLPSLSEGFGLPVLEAMASGTPVVCSNATSLPEVAGDAALMVDPHDVEGMSNALEAVLSDADLARDLRARGRARAAGFTWERTAALTLDAYQQVLAD